MWSLHRGRHVVSGVLSLVFSLSLATMTVYADYDYKESNGYITTQAGDEPAEGDYDKYFDDAEKDATAKAIWTFLKTNGFNDITCAAVIGNFVGESELNYNAKESGSTGRGIAQWTPCNGAVGSQCHQALSDFAVRTHGHTAGTDGVSNGWLDCLECQLKFFISDTAYGNKNMSSLGYSGHVSVSDLQGDVNTLMDFAKYDFTKDCGGDTNKAITYATELFVYRWEVPSNYYAHTKKRVLAAKVAYNKYSGMKIDASAGTATDNSGGVLNIKGDMNWVLDECDFVNMTKLTEQELPFMTASDLNILDRVELSSWKKAIDRTNENDRLQFPRICVSFCGILLIVYALFLYLAFWFDTVNNFVEINLLSIITFKKLVVSPDGTTSSFSDKEKSSKVVIHKDILIISISGIVFGVLLVSGKVYDLVFKLISLFKDILS